MRGMREGCARGGGRLGKRDGVLFSSSADDCGGVAAGRAVGVFVVEEEGELGAWV